LPRRLHTAAGANADTSTARSNVSRTHARFFSNTPATSVSAAGGAATTRLRRRCRGGSAGMMVGVRDMDEGQAAGGKANMQCTTCNMQPVNGGGDVARRP
jgi:hypothetical protein